MARLLLILLLIAIMPATAFAAKDRVFSLEIENDYSTDTDQYFTNGVRASVAFAETAQKPWMVRLADKIPFLTKGNADRVINLALGQNIYTPHDTDPFTLTMTDRPYAGWLYGEFGVEVQTLKSSEYFSLKVGIIGPASLAAPTQRSYHKLIGVSRPNGWDHQLKNEPGIVIGYQKVWKKPVDLGGGFGFSSNPHVGVALGNVWTYAAMGLTLRFGQGLKDVNGPPPRISPAFPGSAYFKTTRKVVWYVFAGVEGRAVVRDIFLDGNTFTSSHSVSKKNLVADFHLGLVLIIDGIRISYTHVFRTREFHLQPAYHEYSAVNIAFRF